MAPATSSGRLKPARSSRADAPRGRAARRRETIKVESFLPERGRTAHQITVGSGSFSEAEGSVGAAASAAAGAAAVVAPLVVSVVSVAVDERVYAIVAVENGIC